MAATRTRRGLGLACALAVGLAMLPDEDGARSWAAAASELGADRTPAVPTEPGPAAPEPAAPEPAAPEPAAPEPGGPDVGGPDVGGPDVGGAADAPAPPAGAGIPAPGAGYAWPLLPVPAVLTRFAASENPFGPGHRGVDLVGAPGQPVLAAQEGRVVFAGLVAGHGVVSVQHPDRLRTTYEPVDPLVGAGSAVRRGDVLGLLQPGHPGCPAPACLHWGVRRDRHDYLDPLVLLRPPRVRLLPVPVPWPER